MFWQAVIYIYIRGGVFAASVLIATIGHLVRIYRWRLFINIYEDADFGTLGRSLAAGYAASLVLPFKLGDVLRAYLSGRKFKNGKSLGFSTVIIDRYLDIIAVGVILGILVSVNAVDAQLKQSIIFYAGVALACLVLLLLVIIFRKYVKRVIKSFAGIFAPEIELKILKFCWSLISNFKDIAYRISKIRLLLSTVIMWSLYIISYWLLAKALELTGVSISWSDIFVNMFDRDNIQISGLHNSFILRDISVYYIVFMVAPTVLLFILSLLKLPFTNEASSYNETDSVNLLPHTNMDERRNFLEMYFSGKHREYIAVYLRINQHILILRDCSAGSNATTMLCMDSGHNFYRKYAFGADGDKLYAQVRWIEEYQGTVKLPTILRQDKQSEFCYYDMPSLNNAVGMFEYAHTMPIDASWTILQTVLTDLENSLYTQKCRTVDSKSLHSYIDSKVTANIDKIINGKHIKPLMKYDTVIINGIEYHNLEYYRRILNKENLSVIFGNDSYSAIHGDLTIENIICTRDADGVDSYYLIDPNIGNIHDSPNLDYGKLLQSIHGGYEFMMKTQNVSVFDNKINFISTKSQVYVSLHKKLDDFMNSHFTLERVRSIYYHEMVHWLRLMPYKIEKNDMRSVIFYAGLLIVFDDIYRRFGDNND